MAGDAGRRAGREARPSAHRRTATQDRHPGQPHLIVAPDLPAPAEAGDLGSGCTLVRERGGERSRVKPGMISCDGPLLTVIEDMLIRCAIRDGIKSDSVSERNQESSPTNTNNLF